MVGPKYNTRLVVQFLSKRSRGVSSAPSNAPPLDTSLPASARILASSRDHLDGSSLGLVLSRQGFYPPAASCLPVANVRANTLRLLARSAVTAFALGL